MSGRHGGADQLATEGRRPRILGGRRPIGFGNSTMPVPPAGSSGKHRPEGRDDHDPPDQRQHDDGDRPPTTSASLPVGKVKASVANRANVSDTLHFGEPGDGLLEGRRGQGLQLVCGRIDRQERHGERPAHAQQHPADDVPRPPGDEDRTDTRVWHVRREEDDQGESPWPSREQRGLTPRRPQRRNQARTGRRPALSPPPSSRRPRRRSQPHADAGRVHGPARPWRRGRSGGGRRPPRRGGARRSRSRFARRRSGRG